MGKDFDGWNEVKQAVHAKQESFGVHERELWWVSLGLNIGVETDGKHGTFERPVLVLRAFNRQMVWVLPTTTTIGDTRFYYQFSYGSRLYAVMLTQIRTISTKRLIRKIGTMSVDDFETIRRKCRMFLEE